MNPQCLLRFTSLIAGIALASAWAPEIHAQAGGGTTRPGGGTTTTPGNTGTIGGNLPAGTNLGTIIGNLPAGTNLGTAIGSLPAGTNLGTIVASLPPGTNLSDLLSGLTGGAAITTPTIIAAGGILTGESSQAIVVVPGQVAAAPGGTGGAPTSNPTATYQWTISGGKITSSTTAQTVTYVATTAGTVTLGVRVSANGTSYDASSTVTALSSATAGTIAAPATAAASNNVVTATVPPAVNGDRTFLWTVSGDAAIASGQRTNTITIRPGTPGLKEVSCDVTLQRLATVNVRSFLLVTGSGPSVNVTVNGGSGGGTWPGGSRVDIFANPPPAGQVFDKWTGDTGAFTPATTPAATAQLLTQFSHQIVTVPNNSIALTATYKSALAWAPISVANFNLQPPASAAGSSNPVSTTLTYYIPAAAQGVVFLLHETGGKASDWFTLPEQILLTRDLVAAGYGVAAVSSVNRTAGAWAATTALANNPDALNHAAALDKFARDGTLAANKPIFFLGLADGGEAGAIFAELFATATPARPVKGVALYCAAGSDTLAVTSKIPQFFALAANDENLGAAGNATARTNSQLMAGRGLATGVATNGPSPVLAGRFLALGLTTPAFSATDAQAVHYAIKTAGLLDSNNYLKAIPSADELKAALPAAYQSRAGDVATELSVAYAARQFYSDANARVIAFLNGRVADSPVPAPGRLVNLSTRSSIAYLGDSLSLGFNLSGTAKATLMIRGIGPTLAKFGLASALAAPRLEVYRGSTVIAANEGWDKPGGTATAAQITTAAAGVGAFALTSGALDAAVLVQLDPGTYTTTITGLGGAVGDVLAEIYDVSRNGTRLTNLSTLAKIGSPGDLLIPGLVVAGNNPRTLLIRAVGPGLQDFGITTYLGDPRITVLEGTTTVDTNNNWAQGALIGQPSPLPAVFSAVGAFPLKTTNSDAALVTALAPSAYTLQAGAAPAGLLQATTAAPTGSVLVEVYEVP